MGTSFAGRTETLLTSWINLGSRIKAPDVSDPSYVDGDHRLLDRTWNRYVVKSRDVFPHKFSAQRGGEVAQVPGDNLARIGPSRIAVREVVGLHAVIGSPP